jgi:hypothetical protein
MRIVEDYSGFQDDLIEIKSAEYRGDFVIKVYFTDGTDRLVDFKTFLMASLHPSIRKYLNEVQFRQFNIVDGNLNWNDYDLIFPIDDLYNGKL